MRGAETGPGPKASPSHHRLHIAAAHRSELHQETTERLPPLNYFTAGRVRNPYERIPLWSKPVDKKHKNNILKIGIKYKSQSTDRAYPRVTTPMAQGLRGKEWQQKGLFRPDPAIPPIPRSLIRHKGSYLLLIHARTCYRPSSFSLSG